MRADQFAGLFQSICHRSALSFGHHKRVFALLASPNKATDERKTKNKDTARLGVRGSLPEIYQTLAVLHKVDVSLMPLRQQPEHQISTSPEAEGQILLSAQDLTALTGTVQPARQRRWLDARGWPYVEASGRGAYPRVSRRVFDAKMEARDPGVAAPQPRFEALDRLGSQA